jgi:hypothetical protein
VNNTQGNFEIVYCALSDGSPCANWAWRGKTPQAVAVLERSAMLRQMQAEIAAILNEVN